MYGFRTTDSAPPRGDSVTKPRRRPRVRPLAVAVVSSVLACGTLSFASDSTPARRTDTDRGQRVDAVSGPPQQAAPTTDSPSGEAMPVGNLPGWKQVFTEDFASGNVPVGGFPGETYGPKWSANYADGTPDTAAKTRRAKSVYFPSKVLSVHDGVLDMYLHSENGISMGAAPAPKLKETSESPYNGQLYGRYSVRFKSDALKGYKTAWLLWPVSKQWPRDGEIDFPEGDLAASIYAAVHGIGSTKDDRVELFRTTSSFTSWHTATTEWSPGRVEFFLDGKSIGVSTAATPNKPMKYVLQTESCLPKCPEPGTSGHLYVDWVAIWEKN
jgi:hypothetical protein